MINTDERPRENAYRAVQLGLHSLEYIINTHEKGLETEPGVVTKNTTHIVYGPISYNKEGYVTFSDEGIEEGNRHPSVKTVTMAGLIDYVREYKKIFPWIKIVVNVPGSDEKEDVKLSDILDDPKTRETFVASLADLMKRHFFDGAQIDFSVGVGFDGVTLTLSEIASKIHDKEIHAVIPLPVSEEATKSAVMLNNVCDHSISIPVENEIELREMMTAYSQIEAPFGFNKNKFHVHLSTVKVGHKQGVPEDVKSAFILYMMSMKGEPVRYMAKGRRAVITDRCTTTVYPMMTGSVVKRLGDAMRELDIAGVQYGPVGYDLHCRHACSIIFNVNKFVPLSRV